MRASCSNSARGYTARLWSWLLVTINPPASASRNLAGNVSRPLSSSLGV
ncbi:Uncharacterised protein [Mycobacteroides abscessus subsp. abscessus]|nr:Uncharacterised protein [Mycobacteroides abscessus subsp. abscessus]